MKLKNVITVIGVHAEGEVGRIISGGVIDSAVAPPAPMYRHLRSPRLESDQRGRRRAIPYFLTHRLLPPGSGTET